MADKIKMRVNVAQYGGKPISLAAMFDPATEVLAIVRVLDYETSPRDGWLRITTRVSDPVHDAVFSEDEVAEAVAAYFDLSAMGLIQYGSVTQVDPKSKIEADGMTETGIRYRLAADIGNAQVAVLIAALFGCRQRQVAGMADFMNELLTI